MNAVNVVFMVIAVIFAVAAMAYVIVDIAQESKKKQESTIVDSDKDI